MKTYTRTLSVAALALAFTLPTFAAPKTSLTSELAKSMTAAAKVAKPTLEQLAADYAALAALPASASDFICISDISGLMQQTGADQSKGFPTELTAIDSLALGSVGENVKLYPALISFIEKSQQTPAFSEDGTPINTMDAAYAELAKAPALEPIYAILTCKDGQEELLNSMGSIVGENQFLSPVDNAPAGFKGGKVDWDRLQSHGDLPAEAKASLKQRPLHVFSKVEGKALIIVACEDPAKLASLPATPAASALGKAAKALKAGAAGQSPVFTMHLSAETAKALCTTGSESIEELEGMLKDASPVAAQSLREVVELSKTFNEQPMTKPAVVQVWRDDRGLSIDASLDAQGASFKSGKFRMASMGNAGSTIFYAETTPFTYGEGLPSMPHILRVLADGMLAASSIGNDISTATLPLTKEVTASIETMLSGMEGNAAIVIDNKGTMPAIFGGEGTGSFPRIGVYAGIEDRAKLSEGWDKLMASLEEGGMNPEEMKVESKVSGKVTRYSIDNPMFTKDFIPNVILTDRHMAFGTAPALNVQLLKAAGKTGKPAVGKGAMFVLRFKPAAKCVEDATAGSTSTVTMGGVTKMLDNIRGTATVQNGAYSIRMRVDFSDKAAK